MWSSTGAGIYYNGGKVGIGTGAPTATLDVNGTVRVGTSATTCTSALAGMIRKNEADIEVCQSAVWMPLSRRAAGDMTIYVRADGSDTACDGSADAAAASAPACAFATPNKAMDAIPDVVSGTVTVSLQAGTYNLPAAGTADNSTLNLPVRQYSASGNIVIQPTSGTVVLSGAKAAAPTTAVANYVVVGDGSKRITLNNLTVSYGVASNVQFANGADVTISTMTINNSVYGITAIANSTIATTSLAITSSSTGIFLNNSHMSLAGTNAIVTSVHGVLTYYGSVFSTSTSATLSISGVTGYGLYANGASQILSGATTTISGVTGCDVGIYAASASQFIHNTNSLTITYASGGWSQAIAAVGMSYVNISMPTGKALSMATGAVAATQYAVYAAAMSNVQISGAGTYASSTNFDSEGLSSTKSWLGLMTTGTVPTQAGVVLTANYGSSIYTSGSWTAAGTCDASSDCH